MHDTSSLSTPETARQSKTVASAKAPKAAAAAPQAPMQAHRGLFARMVSFIAKLFKPKAKPVAAPVIDTSEERAAAARAAQMPPPVAFKGDTASTLATPISAYAGKPAIQAIRKRAEQQFKLMDTNQSTMH